MKQHVFTQINMSFSLCPRQFYFLSSPTFLFSLCYVRRIISSEPLGQVSLFWSYEKTSSIIKNIQISVGCKNWFLENIWVLNFHYKEVSVYKILIEMMMFCFLTWMFSPGMPKSHIDKTVIIFLARNWRTRAVKFRPKISDEFLSIWAKFPQFSKFFGWAMDEIRPNWEKFTRNFWGRTSTARIRPFRTSFAKKKITVYD
jgi:hypothetical protein